MASLTRTSRIKNKTETRRPWGRAQYSVGPLTGSRKSCVVPSNGKDTVPFCPVLSRPCLEPISPSSWSVQLNGRVFLLPKWTIWWFLLLRRKAKFGLTHCATRNGIQKYELTTRLVSIWSWQIILLDMVVEPLLWEWTQHPAWQWSREVAVVS